MHTAQVFTPSKRQPFENILHWIKQIALSGRRVWLDRLPGAVFFFLLSIAKCFSVPSPYTICCLSAFLFAGLKPKGALMGLFAGICFRILWGIEWDLAQYGACALCYLIMHIFTHNQRSAYFCTVLLLIARALPGILQAENAQTAILCAASVLMGTASMPALNRAAQILKQHKEEWCADDILCFLLPGLLLITGASRLTAFSVNLGYLSGVVFALLVSWAAGASTGVCISLGCGLALMLGGQSAVMLINLTFASLISGVMQGKNRFLTGTCFCLSACSIQFLATFSLEQGLAITALIGSAFFILIPGKYIKKAVRFIRHVCWHRQKENVYTRFRVQKWVCAIDSMARALPFSRIEPASVEEESETIAERLCQHCDRLPICWRDEYEQTKKGMEALANREIDAENGYLDLINHYYSFCPRISALPDLLSELDTARQQRIQRSICADYEREMLKTHLEALSQAAQRISQEGMLLSEEESYWLEQIEEVLQSLRFPGQAAFAKKIDGRMTICLKYEPLSLRPSANETLCRHIGVRLGMQLQVTEQKSGRIILEEEPPLCVFSGMATACAVTPERKLKVGKRLDNGDDVLVKRLSGGKMILALSDGMGHGAGAQDESKKTLELLSLCMEAGYTRSQAVTAVNGAMLSVTGGEKFATVDLCMIDLWSGQTAMNKLGACASLLVQGRKIHRIEGNALPLGIIEHVLPTEEEFILAEGDTLLLMSDGITDAFTCEDEILSILKRTLNDTPQHIADAILQEAIIQQDGLPRDDMTVLCAQITQRHPERQNRINLMR